MKYPRIVRVKQVFDTAPPITDIPTGVRTALKSIRTDSRIRPGDTVAITAGSRWISNITTIMISVIEELKALQAKPFIVPAMGSHGGATSEGQLDVLKNMGITQETMGVSLRSSMEVRQIGRVLGFPVYMDKNACGADHIVIVARIKPHTDFKAEIERGFYKMMAIGLGKHRGASECHRAFLRHGYLKVLLKVGREVTKKSKITFGLGIVENAYDQTAKIVAVPPNQFEQTERRLLRQAKAWMMKLPFHEADLLIVNELGKNISGDGMDPNVIGRFTQQLKNRGPKIGRIVVLNLTKETAGNAVGIGRADFTTKKLVENMNRKTTYVNALTFLDPATAKIPPYLDTDREAIEAAFGVIGGKPTQVKVIRIKNTLTLDEIEISEAYSAELKKRKDLIQQGNFKEMQFDSRGKLHSFG
ncbi:MAG: hypothetical protein ABSD49_09625 [Candidatus Bathyarchaeia archaeon]